MTRYAIAHGTAMGVAGLRNGAVQGALPKERDERLAKSLAEQADSRHNGAERVVNPRVRDEVGEIRLVRPEERVSGAGASWVMASFTHRNPAGSRFSDGSYGVYYAARDLKTAVRETAFHFARFARDSGDGARYEDMRAPVGPIANRFVDASGLPEPQRARVLDPDSYAESRLFGAEVRAAECNGIVYPSVRDLGGQCIAAFRPKAVGLPIQGPVLQYHWDGRASSATSADSRHNGALSHNADYRTPLRQRRYLALRLETPER